MNTISTFDRFRDQVVGHRPCVYFEVNAQDERHFLTFAADMGCMWANGTAIDPDLDTCRLHMAISRDRTIAYVSMMPWLYQPRDHALRLDYAAFRRGELRPADAHLVFYDIRKNTH
ncbi:MAG: hypothetical protein GX653_00390 [Clostridiales bacterium]|nr:hypothetical protein [Clostridiales bacterium]